MGALVDMVTLAYQILWEECDETDEGLSSIKMTTTSTMKRAWKKPPRLPRFYRATFIHRKG